MAARNAASFAFDGLLKPLIFLTNWREAARISSFVTGGSKLKRVLIFLHIAMTSQERSLQTLLVPASLQDDAPFLGVRSSPEALKCS
jgi:hypothetical protein